MKPTGRHRTLPGIVSLLVVLLGLGFAANVAGPLDALRVVLSGLGVAAAWYLLPVPYTIAIGHVLLLALVSRETAVIRLLPVEIGFAGLLLSWDPALEAPLRVAAATALAALGLGVAAWTGTAWGGALWGGALAVAVVTAVFAYGVHRYERLALDLLSEP